jgi:hypothetical protein
MRLIKNFLIKALALLASYGLACALFLLLLLLTYLGTVEQIEHGLFQTQRKYFESLFLVHTFYDTIPMVLPGGYLLLTLLFLNLLAGGFWRLRKGWSQVGVVITHAGILLLLVGGFITYSFSTNGRMRLFEGEEQNVFQSYYEWEVAISGTDENGRDRAFVIPPDVFERAAREPGESVAIPGTDLRIAFSNYMPNCFPRDAENAKGGAAPLVGEARLVSTTTEKSHEQNVPGVYIHLRGETSGASETHILWGLQRAPVETQSLPGSWEIDLRRRQWELSFSIALEKFNRELHPGTMQPSAFSSDIIAIDGDVRQPVKISMNQPFRHGGYIFYQASWGPQNAPPDAPLFSVLAVSQNPADQFPLYACIVIAVGMLVHFTLKLSGHIRRESRGRRT